MFGEPLALRRTDARIIGWLDETGQAGGSLGAGPRLVIESGPGAPLSWLGTACALRGPCLEKHRVITDHSALEDPGGGGRHWDWTAATQRISLPQLGQRRARPADLARS